MNKIINCNQTFISQSLPSPEIIIKIQRRIRDRQPKPKMALRKIGALYRHRRYQDYVVSKSTFVFP